MHPVAQVIDDALNRRFPLVDGGWTRVAPWRAGVEGMVAVTGHAFVVVGAEITDSRLEELGVDGFGGAVDARVTTALAGDGYIEVHDVLLARRAGRDASTAPARESLVPRPDLVHHPRAALAQVLRDDVTVWGSADPRQRDVVTWGRGIGGLPELGLELDPETTAGRSRAVVEAALAVPEPGTPVVAAVAPGNARAVRLFLGGGFEPIGSVQLWLPERATGGERPGV